MLPTTRSNRSPTPLSTTRRHSPFVHSNSRRHPPLRHHHSRTSTISTPQPPPSTPPPPQPNHLNTINNITSSPPTTVAAIITHQHHPHCYAVLTTTTIMIRHRGAFDFHKPHKSAFGLAANHDQARLLRERLAGCKQPLRKRNESCDMCFNLDAELLKSQNAHNDLLKRKSTNLPTTTFELHQTPVVQIRIILQGFTEMLGMKVKGVEEAGIQLNAEQADWKDDTDDKSDDQELEAHYMYMAKLQQHVSYHKLYDILKQHQHEVNKIRAEKIARVANPLALNKGKAVVNSPQPIYDQEPSMIDDDDETSKEKEIDKLMTLISLSFKKIYKPTNNNLQTSSNTRRANQENSPRIYKNAGYEGQRSGTVVRARETVEAEKGKRCSLSSGKDVVVSLDVVDSGPIFDTEPEQ
nr:hypothetical protein [Tanacetum cinerariifolium]